MQIRVSGSERVNAARLFNCKNSNRFQCVSVAHPCTRLQPIIIKANFFFEGNHFIELSNLAYSIFIDFFNQATDCFYSRFADFEGKYRHTVIAKTVPHPFAMTIFEEWMYWTDWNHQSIERANRFTGEHRSTLMNITHRPMDIHVVHPLRQKNGEDGST